MFTTLKNSCKHFVLKPIKYIQDLSTIVHNRKNTLSYHSRNEKQIRASPIPNIRTQREDRTQQTRGVKHPLFLTTKICTYTHIYMSMTHL